MMLVRFVWMDGSMLFQHVYIFMGLIKGKV